MANAVYPLAKQAFLQADIDLLVDDIRAVLVDLADYTYSASHQYLSSVLAGARVAVSGALQSKTITIVGTAAVFDAADITINTVSGDGTEAVILYQHTGNDATARLIAFYDNAELTIQPNGGNITIAWDSGTNKIFSFG